MINATMQDALRRIEARQEAIIAGISGLADIMDTHTEMLMVTAKRQEDLEAWLKEPPKSDLPDLIKEWVAAMEGMQAQIAELPAAVARAVTDGEVPSP